ncbi:MAG: CmcJ/NvfI family oxidoreductase [Dongiaceae bacterium]
MTIQTKPLSSSPSSLATPAAETGHVDVTPSHRVSASLTYLQPTGEKPYIYTFEPPPGVPERSGKFQSYDVEITNGRTARTNFTLDEHGFAFARQATAVTDFLSETEIRDIYYPESAQLIAQATGADDVVIFDHTCRFAPALNQQQSVPREPVQRVHNDYTTRSGPQRVRDLLPAAEAAERLQRRFAIVNLWRPIRGPLVHLPLAICDARSVAAGDLVATDLIYRDRIGETYAVSHNPQHRWFYFPKMRQDEAVLIKSFDSDETVARFSPHTAFIDPTEPHPALLRQSIEIRALVFFWDRHW